MTASKENETFAIDAAVLVDKAEKSAPSEKTETTVSVQEEPAFETDAGPVPDANVSDDAAAAASKAESEKKADADFTEAKAKTGADSSNEAEVVTGQENAVATGEVATGEDTIDKDTNTEELANDDPSPGEKRSNPAEADGDSPSKVPKVEVAPAEKNIEIAGEVNSEGAVTVTVEQ